MKNKKKSRCAWKNSSLPIQKRVRDLISRMTFEEKVSQLTTTAPPLKRFGIEKFLWNGEYLHGMCKTGRATQFPLPIGMAATFDEKLIQKVAAATSDEARAKFHDPSWKGRNYVALMCCTPVINILRDPRWGRSMETYGEDPYLVSVMGAAFVRGLQGDHPKYLKIAACAKHLAVQSGPESLRREFNAIVSLKDLNETYLPAFRALVEEGVATVMATYNRVNGEHCCGSKVLLEDYLRGAFGFDGMVLSDQGALDTVHTSHKITKDAVETAGLCIRRGCDLEIGNLNLAGKKHKQVYGNADEAIERGLLTEADVDRAVERILTVRFKVGEFDPPQKNPYTKIPLDVVQCPKHIRMARETARKSVVMVKNNGILPLGSKHKMIMVTGPNAADLQVLLGNFYRGVSGNLQTILEGIVSSAPEGVLITHNQGCFLAHPNHFDSTWPLGLAEMGDAVIAVMGASPLMEGEQGECIGSTEGGDKSDISIPENQLQYLRKLKKVGRPIVAVVTCGSPLDLREVHKLADAVLIAWYPGEQGGGAVGDLLFGKETPSGKLPVTFPRSLDQVPPFEDYALAGRTYRYMTKVPMYPFGFGLSYTTFEYSDIQLSKKSVKAGRSLTATLTLANTGERKGDEVVQLYLTDDKASVPVPRFALKAFKRVTLQPGQSKTIRFAITPAMMELYSLAGEPVLEPGSFTVTVGGASPGKRSSALGAPKPLRATFELTGP